LVFEDTGLKTTDPILLSIMDDLRNIVKSDRIRLVYSYVEKHGEPEPGPYIDDLIYQIS